MTSSSIAELLKGARFERSAPVIEAFPTGEAKEVAFLGRSNAGKSSTLNAITHKNLAKTAKRPGKTAAVNFFSTDSPLTLVDLPGYGYANVSKAEKAHWHKLMEHYFTQQQQLIGLILVMDIRHPLMPVDEQMLHWGKHLALPVHILLNKADKLSRSAASQTLFQTQKALKTHIGLTFTLQIFSSLRKKELYLPSIYERIEYWLRGQ